MKLVIVTQNGHLSGCFERTRRRLRRSQPDLSVRMHVAADWEANPDTLATCLGDLESADLVLVSQIFVEDHETPILPTLRAQRDRYLALCCIMCSPAVSSLTRMGAFSMDENEPTSPLMKAMRRLRGTRNGSSKPSSGKHQMTVLRNLPRLLRLIPGAAQDLRAYFLVMRYWLAASDENLTNLIRFFADRYGSGPGAGKEPPAPREYPTVGVYHPDLPEDGITERAAELPHGPGAAPRVGLLLMRSNLLAGNRAHYDAVIRALAARGIVPVPAFAAALDQREAAERFFLDDTGRPVVEAVISLTGFSLVGGPAYHDAEAARDLLMKLGVPYIVAQPLELQTIENWTADARGLSPLQASLMVSIPELDGATGPIVFGGRSEDGGRTSDSVPIADRVERLAERVARLVRLRTGPRSDRKVAVVLFNFPPNAGTVGTAAFLDVFESLHRVLTRLAAEGYDVEVPSDTQALRDAVLEGNRERYGTPANVVARVDVDDHVTNEPWLEEIESAWGAAPGRQLVDGRNLLVMGARFGNVAVMVQPPMGYEGDPMRLLFEKGFAPTHAFSAFYRWIRDDFDADAYLHFGTHGATEFMPGKHVGLSANCWPDRLIGDTPNVYLYAANNPSEGALAKRRVAATLVSHLTPPVMQAGLYRKLGTLKDALDGLRSLAPDAPEAERERFEALVRDEGVELELLDESGPLDPVALSRRLLEIETALIPHGLHVLGRPPSDEEAVDLLAASNLDIAADAATGTTVIVDGSVTDPGFDGDPAESDPSGADSSGAGPAVTHAIRRAAEAVVGGHERAAVHELREVGLTAEGAREGVRRMVDLLERLRDNREIDGVVRALDGDFIEAAPAGDLIRRPEILPTGRNLYAFDPYRIPTPAAMAEGKAQARRLVQAHHAENGRFPETVGMVLWGTDNLKRDGAPIAQVLALLGAEPRFDAYGRLAGASLIPLDEMEWPRIDVVATVSGVFRDLMPLQIRLLAEAAWLAAQADEPLERNHVRKHAREQALALGCDLDSASLRVFSNAEQAYGANVNMTVDASVWEEEAELGELFATRKSWAYDRNGLGAHRPELLDHALSSVSLTYQNLDSVELGVSDVDQYFDSLGGLSRAVSNRTAVDVPTYVGDETRPGAATVRTLSQQIELETRTRVLNPKWYEAMLSHGYQGVREIEARVTAAVGWSATTDAVPTWVYRDVSRTFLLDPEMRRRLAELNPDATLNMNRRVLEAFDRGYWEPTSEELQALEDATDDLEDRIEGINEEAAA